MRPASFFGLLALIWFRVPKTDANANALKHFFEYPRTAISGKNLAVYHEVDEEKCALWCLNDPQCHSFDYTEHTRTCFTSNQTRATAGSAVQGDMGYSLFELNGPPTHTSCADCEFGDGGTCDWVPRPTFDSCSWKARVSGPMSAVCRQGKALLESPWVRSANEPSGCQMIVFARILRAQSCDFSGLGVYAEFQDGTTQPLSFLPSRSDPGTDDWCLLRIPYIGYDEDHRIVLRASEQLEGTLELKSFKFLQCASRTVDPQCPPDVVQVADHGATEAVVSWPRATPRYRLASSASCSGGSFRCSYSQGSGTLFPLGKTTVQYTCADSVSNSNTCLFQVNVIQPQDPDGTGTTTPALTSSSTFTTTTVPRSPAVKERCFAHQGACNYCYLGYCEKVCPKGTYPISTTCYLLPPAPAGVQVEGRAVDSIVVRWRFHVGQSDVRLFRIKFMHSGELPRTVTVPVPDKPIIVNGGGNADGDEVFERELNHLTYGMNYYIQVAAETSTGAPGAWSPPYKCLPGKKITTMPVMTPSPTWSRQPTIPYASNPTDDASHIGPASRRHSGPPSGVLISVSVAGSITLFFVLLYAVLRARTWYGERGPFGDRYIGALRALNSQRGSQPPPEAHVVVDLWQNNDEQIQRLIEERMDQEVLGHTAPPRHVVVGPCVTGAESLLLANEQDAGGAGAAGQSEPPSPSRERAASVTPE